MAKWNYYCIASLMLFLVIAQSIEARNIDAEIGGTTTHNLLPHSAGAGIQGEIGPAEAGIGIGRDNTGAADAGVGASIGRN